ncbi:MAG: M23 family metallopeptidase [Actinobacteria bacterium]|nr:M23 family metallopeptidase [Actinomycetota bacterium]
MPDRPRCGLCAVRCRARRSRCAPLSARRAAPASAPRGSAFHAGLDFPAPVGTPVTAAGFGTVVFSGYDPSGFGNMIVIGHRFGLRTVYAHLASLAVRRGQAVGVGQLIGTVGTTGRSSGPHLHFELRLRGANVDPLTAL